MKSKFSQNFSAFTQYFVAAGLKEKLTPIEKFTSPNMKAMLKLHVPQVEIGQKGDRNPHWTTGAKRVWTISLMSGYSEVLKFGALSNPATIANLSRGQVSLPEPQTGVIVSPWNPSIAKQVVQGSEATD